MFAPSFRIRLTRKRLEIRDLATDRSLCFPPCLTVNDDDTITSIGTDSSTASPTDRMYTPLDSAQETQRHRQLACSLLLHAIGKLQSQRHALLRWLRLSPRIEFVLSQDLAYLKGFLTDSRHDLGVRSVTIKITG